MSPTYGYPLGEKYVPNISTNPFRDFNYKPLGRSCGLIGNGRGE